SYRKSETEFIQISYLLSEGTVLSVDTEDAETENIRINGTQGMLIKKGCGQQIVWATSDKSAFVGVIGTGVTTEDLIHIANELEY
ncbi:MAG: DUF4367 domain-containing protein, partial [Oscillospiraceae bacterium]